MRCKALIIAATFTLLAFGEITLAGPVLPGQPTNKTLTRQIVRIAEGKEDPTKIEKFDPPALTFNAQAGFVVLFRGLEADKMNFKNWSDILIIYPETDKRKGNTLVYLSDPEKKDPNDEGGFSDATLKALNLDKFKGDPITTGLINGRIGDDGPTQYLIEQRQGSFEGAIYLVGDFPNNGSAQYFIASDTPEPAAIILLVTGASVIAPAGWFRYRRRTALKYPSQ